LIDQIMAAVAETKLQDETVVLVTADHGGINKGHGGETMSELEIPWILAGPGVRAGTELADPINTFDTAPTVLRALGVAAPAYWIGRAVEPAFK
jgi:arylsulfatase A-like enzyme